jgi:putative nucleotidyltransferase with HDIG domain
MNLFELLGRKATTTTRGGSPDPEEAPLKDSLPEVAEPVSPPKPTVRAPRYSALVLVADEFLHRQLADLFAGAGDDWSCERAATVLCARQLSEERRFSIFITESHVEGGSLVDFLNELHARHPAMLRYFYGATPSEAELKRLVGLRPALISPKNRKEMTLAQFERELVVESWLAHHHTRHLIARFRHLPSIPAIYNQVVAELESPSGSFEVVARLIAQDPLMTAKILQVVNSAIFAPSTPITRSEDAVLLLGAQRTRALLLAVPVFTRYESHSCPGIVPDQLWQHSMEVATFARAIALRAGFPELADAAFTAGLLHDVGKLLLAANLPKEYAGVQDCCTAQGTVEVEMECQHLGTTHAEAAACLFGMWGLPLPVLEAIAHHHQPGRSEHNHFTALTAVHAGNALYYERRQPRENRLDPAYVARLGLLDSRNEWRLACGLPPRFEEGSLREKIRMRQESRVK